MKPIILYEGINTLEDVDKVRKTNKIWEVRDIFREQLLELFDSTYPNLITSPEYETELSKFIKKRTEKTKKLAGNWVFFPWNGTLVHLVNEESYFYLRTNRNRNLITLDEQKKLYNFCVGVVGLSVGSNITTNLIYQGIGKNMKLAEFDDLETTNLNRIRAGIPDLGKSKIKVTTQQIYEIDPYSELNLYRKGLTKESLEDFVCRKPIPKLIFEVIDNFEMKILLRLKARSQGIPIIMLANLGDKVLVDIERYDLNKKLPLFNGLLGNLPERILKNPKDDQNKYAIEIVGLKNIPKRAIDSVKEINKTLVGRPQLSSTVSINGSIATFIARKIALDDHLMSGRFLFSIEKEFS